MSSRKMNLIGKRFTKLLVVSEASKKGKHYRWNCECDCGNKSIVSTTNLRQGGTKSCGCIKKELENSGHFEERENRFIEEEDYLVGITHNGSTFKIDKRDYEEVSEHCWHVTSRGYVKTTIGGNKGRKIFLHRFLMKPNANMRVDHVNRIKVDNRRKNLRICTDQENSMNTNAKGYSFFKDRGKWRAYITVDRKRIWLGSYENESEAYKARRKAELKYFGDFAPNKTEKELE